MEYTIFSAAHPSAVEVRADELEDVADEACTSRYFGAVAEVADRHLERLRVV